MPEFEEFDDYLEINGETFHKPFVEKPVRYESYRMTKISLIKFWDRLVQTKSKTVDFRDVGPSTFLLCIWKLFLAPKIIESIFIIRQQQEVAIKNCSEKFSIEVLNIVRNWF